MDAHRRKKTIEAQPIPQLSATSCYDVSGGERSESGSLVYSIATLRRYGLMNLRGFRSLARGRGRGATHNGCFKDRYAFMHSNLLACCFVSSPLFELFELFEKACRCGCGPGWRLSEAPGCCGFESFCAVSIIGCGALVCLFHAAAAVHPPLFRGCVDVPCILER